MEHIRMTATATPVKDGPVRILVEIPGLDDRNVETWAEVVSALTTAGYPTDNLATPDPGTWVQHEIDHPSGSQRAAIVEGLVPVATIPGVPEVRPVVRDVAGERRTFRECPSCHSFIPEATNDRGVITSSNYPQHYIDSHTGEGATQTMAKTTDKTSPEAMQAQKDAAAGKRGGDATPKPAAAKRSAKAKPAASTTASNGGGTAQRGRPSQYPPEIREAVKIALGIRGAKVGASAKSHALVRSVVGKILKRQKLEPTPANLATVAGFDSFAEIVAIAEGKSDREAVKKLKPLDDKMGDDKWAKGKQLATALAAWGRQLENPTPAATPEPAVTPEPDAAPAEATPAA